MRSDAFARKRTHRQYPNAAIKIHEFPASSMMALRKALQQFSLESPVSSALTWLSRLFWPVMSMPCRSSRPPYPLPTLWGDFWMGDTHPVSLAAVPCFQEHSQSGAELGCGGFSGIQEPHQNQKGETSRGRVPRLASSPSRTFCASASRVKGLARNEAPSSKTPCWRMASPV